MALTINDLMEIVMSYYELMNDEKENDYSQDEWDHYTHTMRNLEEFLGLPTNLRKFIGGLN